MPPVDPNGAAAAIRRLAEKQNQLSEVVQQLQGYMQNLANSPKWIEDIPGKRQPHFEPIEITFSASSTAKKEGTATVSVDGPFVATGLALFFQKTSGAYANIWGPVTAYAAKINTAAQQHGFGYIFDQPHCASFTVEITAQGNQSLWTSKPVASALWAPQAAGSVMFAVQHLFERASTIRLALTPDVSMPYTAKVQGIFLGYRILQGYQYQP